MARVMKLFTVLVGVLGGFGDLPLSEEFADAPRRRDLAERTLDAAEEDRDTTGERPLTREASSPTLRDSESKILED